MIGICTIFTCEFVPYFASYFLVNPMKRILVTCLIFVSISLLLTGFGCNINPKPDIPASAYGKVVDQLPDIPEAKQRYKYPDYVDLRYIPK